MLEPTESSAGLLQSIEGQKMRVHRLQARTKGVVDSREGLLYGEVCVGSRHGIISKDYYSESLPVSPFPG